MKIGGKTFGSCDGQGLSIKFVLNSSEHYFKSNIENLGSQQSAKYLTKQWIEDCFLGRSSVLFTRYREIFDLDGGISRHF